MLKTIQYTLGISLILLGIAGLFLPILQGILLIGLGILVLRGHKVKDVWHNIRRKK
ncbi:MAG: hypothetical protein V1729_03950 [Candidatus Woesearchaeota archaeon]